MNTLLVKREGDVWLGYAGTLAASYDIPCVFEALRTLSEQGYKVRFLIMGDGSKKETFESLLTDKVIDVCFLGRLPYEKMCGVLAACDIVVNPIVHNSAASIINKHADYAACGRPVLNTQESEEYRRLVEDCQMGFNCANGDAENLAEKLKILLDTPELRHTMGENARRCAEERFDRKRTYPLLAQAIENISAPKKEEAYGFL